MTCLVESDLQLLHRKQTAPAAPAHGRGTKLTAFVEQTSDLLERFRVRAQSMAHPTDLDERTCHLLAAIAALTAARTAMRKAASQ